MGETRIVVIMGMRQGEASLKLTCLETKRGRPAGGESDRDKKGKLNL